MAVITPQQATPATSMGPLDMNIHGTDLMPKVQQDNWPTPARIAAAQMRSNIRADTQDTTNGVRLQVTADRKILLPPNTDITEEVIAICHQGDMVHRSMDNTIHEFNAHYKIHGITKTAQQAYIRARCKRCLSCIKTRAGKTIPRPMWYMVYATRPFEYIHIDFMDMPETVNGCKHVLIITDDFSLTTLIHATPDATAATVADVLLNHWLP